MGESFDTEGVADMPQSMPVDKQELMKQFHLRKHIGNLEEEVQKKEELVNRLR